MVYEARFPGFEVSDDRSRLDFGMLHAFLSATDWTPGLTLDQLRRQVDNSSLAFGLYAQVEGEETGGAQVGFGRVVSDLTRFAYLSDFFIVPQLQRQGLGQRFVAAIVAHPELVDVRRWLLLATDAGKGLYLKCGYEPLTSQNWMQVKKREPGRWV